MASDGTIGEWSVQIPKGAGKWEKVLLPYMNIVVDVGVPNLKLMPSKNLQGLAAELTPEIIADGKPTWGAFRVFMTTLPGYAVDVEVRDYGKNLLVTWKVTFDKYRMDVITRFFERKWLAVGKLMPHQREDLTALKTITLDALKQAVRNFENQLDDDFSGEDERSRGIETLDLT